MYTLTWVLKNAVNMGCMYLHQRIRRKKNNTFAIYLQLTQCQCKLEKKVIQEEPRITVKIGLLFGGKLNLTAAYD